MQLHKINIHLYTFIVNSFINSKINNIFQTNTLSPGFIMSINDFKYTVAYFCDEFTHNSLYTYRMKGFDDAERGS